MTTTTTTTTPAAPPAPPNMKTQVDSALAILEEFKTAHQRLNALSLTIAPNSDPEAALVQLHRLWKALEVVSPTDKSIAERVQHLVAARLDTWRSSYVGGFLALIEAARKGVEQLLTRAGGEQVRLVRAVDFGADGSLTLDGTLFGVVGPNLPPDSWIRGIMADGDLVLLKGQRCLALGPVKWPWFTEAQVKEQTRAFASAQRRAAQERQDKEKADKEKVQAAWEERNPAQAKIVKLEQRIAELERERQQETAAVAIA